MRDLKKMQKSYSGTRTITESIMVPEVQKAYQDWTNCEPDGVVIGGVAMSFYGTPRYTTDVDVLYLSADDIPLEVLGFKRHRKSAFEHKKTNVEIEVLTASSFNNVSQELVQAVFDTSVIQDGVRIANKSGIVALKLKRFSLQDKADIVSLVNSLRGGKVILNGFPLDEADLANFDSLKNEH